MTDTPVKEIHLTLVKKKPRNLKADIENRQEYIGGSDIGAILGVNPYKSRYTAWAEKAGLIEPEDLSDNEAVWWGTHLEDLITERFTEKTGIKMKRSNYAYGCEEVPYLKGHVDRISTKGKIGLECKSTSSWNKTNYAEGEVPPMHWWQCQFYLMLTGYTVWYLATKRDNQFYVTKIEPDKEAFKTILTECEVFWNHVMSGMPPEVDDSESTAETLSEMYPSEEPGMLVSLDHVEDTLDAMQEIGTQEKNLKSLKTQYQNVIKDAMGVAERGATGKYIVTWKANKNGSRIMKIRER